MMWMFSQGKLILHGNVPIHRKRGCTICVKLNQCVTELKLCDIMESEYVKVTGFTNRTQKSALNVFIGLSMNNPLRSQFKP